MNEQIKELVEEIERRKSELTFLRSQRQEFGEKYMVNC